MKTPRRKRPTYSQLRGRKIPRVKINGRLAAMSKWRDLPFETREELLEREAKMTAAEWRKWLADKHGIRFSTDSQVSRARNSHQAEAFLLQRNDRTETFEANFRSHNPDASDEEVRQQVMRFVMMDAAADGDYREAISAARESREIDAERRAREKHMRETCELFIKWYDDQRAKDVLAGKATNEEKIEQIGSLIFGDLWRD